MSLAEAAPAPSSPPPFALRRDFPRALSLLTAHPRETMLPLAAVLIPVSLVAAVAWVVLLGAAYPDAPIDHAAQLADEMPRGLLFGMVVLSWGAALFAVVGYAATVVSVDALLRGKPRGLALSLDPPFSRMGGLFAAGAVLFLLLTLAVTLVITVVGPLLIAYVLLRLVFVIQLFILGGRSPAVSFRESWRLTARRAFALVRLLASLVPVAVGGLISAFIVLAVATAPFAASGDPSRAASVAISAAGLVVMAVAAIPVAAVGAILTTLLYHSISAEGPADARRAP